MVKTDICLRPDLIADLEAADTELREHIEAEALQGARLAGKPAGASKLGQDLAKAVKAIEDEIVESTIPFYFQALPKDQWMTLALKHPPRPGDQFDQFAGYNRDATVDAAIRECLIDPVFDDESWDALVAVCNVSEWSEMRRATNEANGRGRRPQNRRWRRGFLPSAPPAPSRPRLARKPPPVRRVGAAGGPRALRRGRCPVRCR